MDNETKKSYAAPDLTVYGGVATLTQTGGGDDDDSSMMNNMSRMSPCKPGKDEHGKPGKSGGRK